MGTDVHAAFQRKVLGSSPAEDRWEYILDHKYEGDRDYFLFAWLADVRNGYGFAGCDLGDKIKPLALPRGLPDGITRRDYPPESDTDDNWWNSEAYQEWNQAGGSLGDHSFSWLTSTEIIEGSKNFNAVNKRGVLSMAEYVKWDKQNRPESYCGAVRGRNVITLTQSQITPQILKGQAYAIALGEEIAKARAKNTWKVKFVKKWVPESTHDGDWEPWGFSLFGNANSNEPKVERYVRKRINIRKSSKQKHLAKLIRYANRMTNMNVKVQWTLTPEAIYKEFSYFIDEVKRLHEKYGEVRMVFGFDS